MVHRKLKFFRNRDFLPAFKPAVSFSIACGWSPVGLNFEESLNKFSTRATPWPLFGPLRRPSCRLRYFSSKISFLVKEPLYQKRTVQFSRWNAQRAATAPLSLFVKSRCFLYDRNVISYLCGTVMAVTDRHIIVDVNGVGYRVTMPEKSLNSIAKIGSEVKLFTHYNLNPRDGSVELYGFQTPEELNFFELLTSVSGIGPKSAQAIISSADLQSLQIGIIKGDDEYLRKISGMGPKTAQRLILELKTKVMASGVTAGGAELGAESEAMDALVALGYSQYQARDAVRQVSDKTKTSEEKIKEALRVLGSRK